MKQPLIAVLISGLTAIHYGLNPSCVNNLAESVDYWVALKFPESYQFVYTDSSQITQNPKFEFQSSTDLRNENNVVDYQLQQIKNNNYNFIAYNDEDPNGGIHSTYGHSKGVLAFNQKGGFWLQHSVPKFPDLELKFSYPEPEVRYGQHFFCLSLDKNSVNFVAEALRLAKVYVYDYQFDQGLELSFPFLEQIILREFDTRDFLVQQFKLKDRQFNLFSKNRKYENFFWDEIVVPFYECGMAFETWRLGIGALHSCCQDVCKYDVINIDYVNLSYVNNSLSNMTLTQQQLRDLQSNRQGSSLGFQQITWKWSHDHSKWGISIDSSCAQVVCFGDINREYSQNKRGGTAICSKDSNLYQLLSQIVSQMDHCERVVEKV
eukprot:TRINITY_DN6429_c0_g1_i10.p1 TRINITY_DN6429_c0_g1~~TRINITY_DN6429_c0_g1_i10.p1  ORF type:complete len:377 (-),score=22.29 TRINITY_DN6429_c0_g1_i10:390-1520(-)